MALCLAIDAFSCAAETVLSQEPAVGSWAAQGYTHTMPLVRQRRQAGKHRSQRRFAVTQAVHDFRRVEAITFGRPRMDPVYFGYWG